MTESNCPSARLLIVDDNPGVSELIRNVGEDLGYAVRVAAHYDEFEPSFTEHNPTFITLDLDLPGADGVEILRNLSEGNCNAQIAVISGFDSKVMASAMRIGKYHGLKMVGTLRKPFDIDELEALLQMGSQEKFVPDRSNLAKAIEQGHIRPHFQPKATLREATGFMVRDAEALARWEHPEAGLISPAQFIPLAEKNGLIDALTWSMLRSTAEHMVAWRAQGLEMTVSLNVAAGLLTELDYPDRMSEMVREVGAQPDWFTLEITESSAMSDAERALDILTRLRLKGFNLSCDDFGTGYSSLVQLYRMPFGELKIDQSFVRDCEDHEEARAIIRVSTDLGHSLGLKVCAEGVETRQALDYLLQQGCDSLQGYYIGKPVPAEQFPALVEKAESMLSD